MINTILNMEQVENFEEYSDTSTSGNVTLISSKTYQYAPAKGNMMVAEEPASYGLKKK